MAYFGGMSESFNISSPALATEQSAARFGDDGSTTELMETSAASTAQGAAW